MDATASIRRRPIVISGPSGSGKSTILTRLFVAHPDTFGFSVSHTTRKPRPGEVDGREYNFTSREAFRQLVSENEFIEHAQFGGNLYGTSIAAVKAVADAGQICVLDIEMEGVKQIQKTDLGARLLFLSPPSLDILETRLRGRGTDDEVAVRKRLEQAKVEMDFQKKEASNAKIVINDNLDEAYQQVEEWILNGGEYGDK